MMPSDEETIVECHACHNEAGLIVSVCDETAAGETLRRRSCGKISWRRYWGEQSEES
jgi:hypothetical protein